MITRAAARRGEPTIPRYKTGLLESIHAHAGPASGFDRYLSDEEESRAAWRPLVGCLQDQIGDPFVVAHRLTHMEGEAP